MRIRCDRLLTWRASTYGGAVTARTMPAAAHEEAVRASWEEGKAREVIGSPHFFTNTGGFFCPALEIKRVDGHLRISMDPPAFEAFVASCFEI